jgi:hypothetical protein
MSSLRDISDAWKIFWCFQYALQRETLADQRKNLRSRALRIFGGFLNSWMTGAFTCDHDPSRGRNDGRASSNDDAIDDGRSRAAVTRSGLIGSYVCRIIPES